jgi:hypothetical protein
LSRKHGHWNLADADDSIVIFLKIVRVFGTNPDPFKLEILDRDVKGIAS